MAALYSVLLVEDEPRILNGIRKKIERVHDEFVVVGEAENGVDGLKFYRELRPDVLVTDIRMPMMDGLDLIAAAKAIHPQQTCIVISGYEDFSLAQHSIRLGVFDYLIKPPTDETVREMLERVKAQLDILYHTARRSKLKRWLDGDDGALDRRDFTAAAYMFGYLCVGPHRKTELSIGSPYDLWLDYDAFKAYALNVVPSCLGSKDKVWAIPGAHRNEIYFLFELERPVAESLQLHEWIVGEFVPAGASSTLLLEPLAMDETAQATIKTWKQRLRERVVIGRSQRVDPEEPLAGEEVSAALIRKISAFHRQGHWAQMRESVNEMFDYWQASALPQLAAEYYTRQLVHLADGAPTASGLAPSAAAEELDYAFATAADMAGLKRAILRLLEDLFASSGPDSVGQSEQLVHAVEAYMRVNYAEAVTLPSLSERFHVSSSYLSRIFKRHTGMAPIEFLTRLRIEEACRLLSERQDLLLKDIAGMLGVNDSYYFSKLFKSIVGTTPSEYRRRQGN